MKFPVPSIDNYFESIKNQKTYIILDKEKIYRYFSIRLKKPLKREKFNPILDNYLNSKEYKDCNELVNTVVKEYSYNSRTKEYSLSNDKRIKQAKSRIIQLCFNSYNEYITKYPEELI